MLVVALLSLFQSVSRFSDTAAVPVQAQSVGDAIEREAKAIEPRVIAWRRDIHQNPELGNREFRTAELVAEHLRKLGYEVREKVAATPASSAVLEGRQAGPGGGAARRHGRAAGHRGGRPAVRLEGADQCGTGSETGVMHACGHDAHTAILMAAAEVLAGCAIELPGTVKFIFQPAEEGPPLGEEGGARLMIKEGVLENPEPEAIFGLHVDAPGRHGHDRLRAGAAMAGSDHFRITVQGHGRRTARGRGAASTRS